MGLDRIGAGRGTGRLLCEPRKRPLREDAPKVCRGPGTDGFYRFDAWPHCETDGLLHLAELGLLEVFWAEVLE